MNPRQFRAHRDKFLGALKEILREQGAEGILSEAAFPAYTDTNSLIRFLFWRRLWVTIKFLESQGPFEAVLDFGCGSGVMLGLLSELARRVVGVDIDISPFAAVSQRLEFPGNIEVYPSNEKPLDSFGDDSFDAVTCLDVLEHVDDLEETIGQFQRIIKPGGSLVVSGPTENAVYRIGRKIAGKEYTGDYHVRNIYDIGGVMKRFVETKTVATLYYPFPLFKVYAGEIRV